MSAVGLKLKTPAWNFHKGLEKQRWWQQDNTDYELSSRFCIPKLLLCYHPIESQIKKQKIRQV